MKQYDCTLCECVFFGKSFDVINLLGRNFDKIEEGRECE
jgi:hypothetical protein